MLVDIFSSLDFYYIKEDCEGFVTGASYLGFVIGALAMHPQSGGFWVKGSGVLRGMLSMFSVIFGIAVDCKGYRFGGLTLGCVGGFWVIALLNFGGMVPGSCSITSQLSVGLSLSFMWWFWCVLSGVFYSWKEFLGHLLPLGTPAILCPLMVLIETVSVLIRPITLAVRLVANITMGHLVLSLMGDSLIGSGSVVVGGYVLFEFFVCSLQAYVFVLLVSLYSADHPGH
uniref:ATP synthase subunit a n=1 Tax=Monodontina vondembuschiana TaxID=2508272 RepID=A0A513X0G3_9BIVA|nr:ATP synthase F0 subunit 6 [Monodontina vondembuschiana]